MSDIVTVHVRGPDNLSSVSECIANIIGHPLTMCQQVNGNLFTAECFGLDIQVYENDGYEDDCGIPFTAYSFVINIKYIGGMLDPDDDSIALQLLTGKHIGRYCRRFLTAEYMVVRNSQKLIESG
jgi:hypothetical protein